MRGVLTGLTTFKTSSQSRTLLPGVALSTNAIDPGLFAISTVSHVNSFFSASLPSFNAARFCTSSIMNTTP